MKNKIQEIKVLLDELEVLTRKEDAYYEFKSICKLILNLLCEIHAEKHGPESKKIYNGPASRLSHTIDKEVAYIKSYQDKMNKKNAAKLRRVEYFNALNKAYAQVRIDIV